MKTAAAKTAYKIIDYYGQDVGRRVYPDAKAAEASITGRIRRELKREGISYDAETFDTFHVNYRVVEVGSVCRSVKKQSTKDVAYDEAYDAIHARIAKRIRRKPVVRYSVGELVKGLPVDNLDEIAVEGKVCLQWGNGRSGGGYTSPWIENPKWLGVAAFADMMLRESPRTDHCFLESVEVVRTDEYGVKCVRLFMGS